MTKEEELDNEEMDSDFDETDHAQMNNGNGHHHPVCSLFLIVFISFYNLRLFKNRKTKSTND